MENKHKLFILGLLLSLCLCGCGKTSDQKSDDRPQRKYYADNKQNS